MMDKIDIESFVSPSLATYPAGASFGPRQGGDFEFVWMLQGRAQARIDGQAIELGVDSLLLRRPGATDYYAWDPERPSVHGYCHFKVRAFPKAWPPQKDWPLTVKIPEKGLLRSLLDALLDAEGLQPVRQAEVLPPLLEALLSVFVAGAGEAAAARKLPVPLQFAVQALDVQISEKRCKPLPLKELAKRSHVGPEHLCRLFAKHFGTGPIQYFMKKRLEQAATLLRRSNLTVKEVATATGFEDPYHFSKAFTKQYRLSPLKYRQKA